MRKEMPRGNWTSRWFFLGGPWEVSIYGVAQTKGHIPQVFCTPSWLRNSSIRTLTIRKAINAMFCLRVNPWPSDFINESNLRTFRLAPVEWGQRGSHGHRSSLRIFCLQKWDLVCLQKWDLIYFRSETSSAYKSETTKLPMLMNRIIPMVLTPIGTASGSWGSLPRS